MKTLISFLFMLPISAQQVVTWTPEMDHAYVNGRMQYRTNSNSAAVKVL